MQVILTEDVESLGAMGDMVNVRNGFARNYLIPRGLAMAATSGRVKQLGHQRRVIDDKRRKRMTELEAYARQLSTVQLDIPMRVGEEDKIFGTVTNAQISDALAARGYEVDRRKISIDEPIRALGLYTVTARLSADVKAEIKVLVTEDKSAKPE